MHLIETRNLCYSYRGTGLVLDNVNFIAGRKKRIAVIGANGAGKSTLFKHFNGILKPTSGEVLIRGEPITRQNIREVRKFIGIVFQDPDDQIFSPTVEQDVAFGPSNLGLDTETIQHRVDEALRIVGIEDLRSRVPHHLSGGEKKRVSIAGIIAMEPQVMVMDEPTAGLDPLGVSDLVDFINALPEKHGMTVIVASHNLEIVTEIADEIWIMNQGSIVGKGTMEEIFVQEDLLNSARLQVPVLPRLIRSLQRQGVDIRMGFTYDEVEAALSEKLKRSS
jgi:cobalt/nickel transport system ATP-binding protein